ncbi:MAG: DUF309 domain-containing protein [Thaumarchaeota archaeon]|nr:MAG: DUF309 domain-containing protein [Nitrososphaerota archaeon]
MNKLLRYMVYLRNKKYFPQDASSILSLSRKTLQEDKIIIRDVRIANHFLELDISIASFSELEKIKSQLSMIAPVIEIDRIVEKDIDKEESIKLARELFNNEKYWKTHEVLEGTWKHTRGNEKELLNGIILVAAALVHYQKGEQVICISILKRALNKLNNSRGKYFGINIDSLKNEITNIIGSTKVSKFRI